MFDSILNKIDLSNLKYSGIKRIFKVREHLNHNRNKTDQKVNQLLFIIIFHSHLKYFLSIVTALDKNKINYSIISLKGGFEEELRPYAKNIIGLNSYYEKYDVYISSLLQFFIFVKYLILNNKKKAFATLKSFKDFYLIRVALKNIIKKNRIKSICMYKGDGLEALTIGLFVKNNFNHIKIIVLQHGLIASLSHFKQLYIDEFWVWSSFFKKRLYRLNVDYKVKVVGDSTKDNLFNSAFNNNIERIEVGKVKILFLPNHGNSHTPISQVLYSLKLVLQYATEHISSTITIKPHPGDVNNVITSNINNQSLKCKVELLSKEANISFENHDIIIINNSTIGMDAALYGKPVIILAENKEQVMVEQYVDYGFAEIAYNYDELLNKIELLTLNYSSFQEKTKLFINDMYDYQGKSADRIIQELSRYK